MDAEPMWFRMLGSAVVLALLAGGPTAASEPVGWHDGDSLAGATVRGAVERGAVARGAWAWPLAPPHAIARPYLAPPTPYASGHRGIDIRAPDGAIVSAPAEGVVHFAGVVADRPVLSIDHGNGVLSSFEPVSTTLVAGDRVARGQAIGLLLPGHCSSPCLHLGARIDGEYVNPLLFLGGVPWSVLLPP